MPEPLSNLSSSKPFQDCKMQDITSLLSCLQLVLANKANDPKTRAGNLEVVSFVSVL